MHTTHERGTITQSTTYDIWFSQHFGKRWWSKSIPKYLVKLVNPCKRITSWEKKKILESQMEFESSRMAERSGRNRWELFLSNVFRHLFQWWLVISCWRGLRRGCSILEKFSPFSCNWQNMCTDQKPGSCEIELTPEAKISSLQRNRGISLPCQQWRSWCLKKLMILFSSPIRDLEGLAFYYMDWNKTLSL